MEGRSSVSSFIIAVSNRNNLSRRQVIPEVVRLISFGRVVWLLEKAGIPLLRGPRGIGAAIRCSENIARWWIWEHQEREQTSRGVCFPGDTSFTECMLPSALGLPPSSLPSLPPPHPHGCILKVFSIPRGEYNIVVQCPAAYNLKTLPRLTQTV